MEKAKEKVKERPEAVGRECLWYLCDMFDVGSLHITIHCKDIILYNMWCITIKKKTYDTIEYVLKYFSYDIEIVK